MKVLLFAGTNSIESINKHLVRYAGHLLQEMSAVNTHFLDLNDYELPLFSQDIERQIGEPKAARDFLSMIDAHEAIVVSFAEHNGSYSVAYKNIFDWASRIRPKVFQDKKMVLLATSPGGRGGISVLTQAQTSMPFFGATVCATLSVPDFYANFDKENAQLTNEELNTKLKTALKTLV